jgi:hypothetical protein
MAAVLVLIAGFVVTSAADTPDPVIPLTAHAVVNADGTQTIWVQGTWQWTTHHTDCNTDRYAVGWAVDWNDPDQPGNVVGTVDGTTVDVGTAQANGLNPADNAVHHYPGPSPARCGTYGPHGTTSYNTGSWGPLAHTYAADVTDIQVCVVMYDIHLADGKGGPKPPKGPKGGPKDPKGPKGGPSTDAPKAGDLIAGGTGHNHDNSVQDNADTPLGNQCTLVPVTSTTTTTFGGA